jgi:hypothetical protein
MTDYLEGLFERYRRRGLILDTNILLLYFIGTFNREEISKFKRTKEKFTDEDYDILLLVLEYFDKSVTTPNILTEVSNISGQLGEHLHLEYFNYFATGIQLLTEEYVLSRDVARMENFYKFGLTDLAIMSTAREKYLVLTEDFKLSQYLQSAGVDVLNFNHLRTYLWQ